MTGPIARLAFRLSVQNSKLRRELADARAEIRELEREKAALHKQLRRGAA